MQDIDDALKKASNQLRASSNSTDTNIFWLVPSLEVPSLRVPKSTNGGTSAPANPSFRSPWIGKSLQEIATVLQADLPRLGAFVKPSTFMFADDRFASDGTLCWANSQGGRVDFVRASVRAAALHLSRGSSWSVVKSRWEERRRNDGDVLDDVVA